MGESMKAIMASTICIGLISVLFGWYENNRMHISNEKIEGYKNTFQEMESSDPLARKQAIRTICDAPPRINGIDPQIRLCKDMLLSDEDPSVRLTAAQQLYRMINFYGNDSYEHQAIIIALSKDLAMDSDQSNQNYISYILF